MGDPAGIGGELTLKTWLALRAKSTPFVVLDDPDRLAALATDMGLDARVQVVEDPQSAIAVFPDALPVLPIRLAAPSRAGQPDPANAAAIVAAIERATMMALSGQVSGVVTNPINKASLYRSGFRHPGHTEFLAALTRTEGKQVMMLASPLLRVVPVTVHASLRSSIDMLTAELIISTARTTYQSLKSDFGLSAPRLAMAGLNPHAGEKGALGCDEALIIEPALSALRQDGIHVSGPWPPDTMFTRTARARYDVAICMYHDQALIPLKTLDMDRGVNVTLGLPIVRTSPDHGTAYDIAGRNIASPSSVIAAVKLAAYIAGRRRKARIEPTG